MENENAHAFDEQIKRQVKWISEKPEAVREWLREQELFYRATDYRGS